MFFWDKKSQRYRYGPEAGATSGQFVRVEALQNLISDYIDVKQSQARALTQQLFDGNLSVSAWEQAIARELKEAHILTYSIGKGGMKQLSSRDYGLIGNKLKGEYQYLRQSSQDILDGKMSQKEILARLDLYNQSLYLSYSKAQTEAHIDAGYRWERRRTTAAESCTPCILYAARGWSPIGGLPEIGTGSKCKMNCKCYKEFSSEMVKPTNDRLLGQRFGWLENKLSSSLV
jgi:hypothetical protein